MMLGLVITDPLPPGIQLGPIPIRFYGLAYVAAFAVGLAVAGRHLARRGVPAQLVQDIGLWAIVFGMIGARLYFVVQNNFYWYLTHPQHIFAIWEGGMAFFGAIFGAVAVLLVMAWRHHLNFWDLLDAGVLFAAIGQPIGRIGNILNGEILGPPSDLPWAIAYTNPSSMAPHLGVGYQPANVYEALGTLCILAVLLYLRRRGAQPGVLGLTYLVLYPISQLIVFMWRTDAETPVVLLGLKQGQLTAIAVLVLVVPVFAWAWRRTNSRRPDMLPG